MLSISDLKRFEFSLIFYSFRHLYTHKYGTTRVDEVISAIQKSDKLSKLSKQLYANVNNYTGKDILTIMQSIPFFLFAKSETNCLGAMLILNAGMDSKSEDYLRSNVIEAIFICYNWKRNVSFFEEFSNALNSVHQNYHIVEWDAYLEQTPGFQYTQYVTPFLKRDKISVEKYVGNAMYLGTLLPEIPDDEKDILRKKGTPSMHLCCNEEILETFPPWFIVAYPDVAYYATKIVITEDFLYSKYITAEDNYNSLDKTGKTLRVLINYYKSVKGKLETAASYA